MSCAKGFRGPARELDSSRACTSSSPALGFLAESIPAEESRCRWSRRFWAPAFPRLGKQFPAPALLCGEVGARVGAHMGEMGVSARRGLGSAQGPRQPLCSRLAPEHPSLMLLLPGGSVPPFSEELGSAVPFRRKRDFTSHRAGMELAGTKHSPTALAKGRGAAWLAAGPLPTPAAGHGLGKLCPLGSLGCTGVMLGWAPPSPLWRRVLLCGETRLVRPAPSLMGVLSQPSQGFLFSSESEKVTSCREESRGFARGCKASK